MTSPNIKNKLATMPCPICFNYFFMLNANSDKTSAFAIPNLVTKLKSMPFEKF